MKQRVAQPEAIHAGICRQLKHLLLKPITEPSSIKSSRIQVQREQLRN
jgi:hypothetical protein